MPRTNLLPLPTSQPCTSGCDDGRHVIRNGKWNSRPLAPAKVQLGTDSSTTRLPSDKSKVCMHERWRSKPTLRSRAVGLTAAWQHHQHKVRQGDTGDNRNTALTRRIVCALRIAHEQLG